MKLKDLDIYAIGDTIQMAGAIYSGEGKTFLVFFPGEKNDLPQEILEMDADEWKKFLFQTDVLETVIIEKASDGSLAKAVVRKSQRQIDNVMMWSVWRRDGYHCRYCGKNDVPLTVDHLVPWEQMGPTVPENLVTTDKNCNKVRGNLGFKQWLEHPYYKKVSVVLTENQQLTNLRLLETLDSIPRMVHRRSR